MNRFSLINAILLTILLAACGTSPPDPPPEYGWCYEYDFRSATNYSETILDGTRTALGIESVNGLINASITHTSIVSPIQIRALAQIQLPGSDYRQFSVNYDVFGISDQINQQINNSQSVEIVDSPDPDHEASNQIAISFATQSDTTAIIDTIQIYGSGINPFPVNNCGGVNPTATPSATPTQTEPPSPTPTIDTGWDWCYKYTDFSDWYIYYPGAGQITTNRIEVSDYNGGGFDGGATDIHRGIANARVNLPSSVRRMEMYYYTDGFDLRVPSRQTGVGLVSTSNSWTINYHPGSSVTYASDAPDSGVRSVEVGYDVSFGVVYLNNTSNRDSFLPSRTGYVDDVRVYGNGSNPYGVDNCNDVSPTSTPAPTDTPDGGFNFLWCRQFDFSISDGGFRLADTNYLNGEQTSGGWADSIGWYPENDRVAIEINIPDPIDQRLITGVEGIGTDSISLWAVDEPYTGSDEPFVTGVNQINYTGSIEAKTIYASSNDNDAIKGIRVYGPGINNPFGENNCDQYISGLPSVTPQPTLTPWATDTPAPTSTVNPAPTAQPTATPDPADDTNSYTPDGTCERYTGSETSGSGLNPFEWLFGGLVNFYNCVLMPPINFVANAIATSVAIARDTFTWLTTSLYNAITAIVLSVRSVFSLLRGVFLDTLLSFGTQMLNMYLRIGDIFDFIKQLYGLFLDFVIWIALSLLWINGWFQNLWRILTYYLLELLINGATFLINLYLLVTDLMSIARSFAGNMLDFILTAIVFAASFLNMWNTATPEPIPGLPDCLNAPLDHNICAVWYILDNTMFSGIGAFIIPALTIFVSILVVLYFMETVVERLQKLWEIFRR